MPLVSDIDIKCCLQQLQSRVVELEAAVTELENAPAFDLAAALSQIAGYDADEEQTLQNLEGTLTWVTNEGGV